MCDNNPEEELSFVWGDHWKCYGLRLSALLESQDLTDVILHLKGGQVQIKAHKIILWSASEYFRKHLKSQLDFIVLPQTIEPNIFRQLLSFIYRGNLKYKAQDLSILKEIATKLQIHGLQNLKPTHKKVTKIKEEEEEESQHEILDSFILQQHDDNDDEEEDDEEEEEEEPEEKIEQDEEEENEEAYETLIKKRGRPRKLRKTLNDENLQSDPYDPDSKTSVQHQLNNKKYLCSLCGRTLTGLTAYNRHQVIHTGARPFSCGICGKTFTQNQRLTVHKRSHTGERPYLCSLCGKTFTESCKLKRHLTRVHKANKDGSALVPGQPVLKANPKSTAKPMTQPDDINSSIFKFEKTEEETGRSADLNNYVNSSEPNSFYNNPSFNQQQQNENYINWLEQQSESNL